MQGFTKLIPWSQRLQGARQMLVYLKDVYQIDLFPECPKKQGKGVYNRVLYKWLIDDLRHIEMFLSGSGLRFYDHKRDSKGNLIDFKIKAEDEK